MPVNPTSAPPAYETEVLMISRMRAMLPQAFPVLINRDKWSHPWGVSGPQDSRSRGGHFGAKKGKMIVKAKATDIYLDANKPAEKRLGDLLFDGLVEHRKGLGIDFVIWDKEKSTADGDIRAYPKAPMTCPSAPVWKKDSCLHRNHLHVEFDCKEGDKDHSALLRKIIDKIKLTLGQSGTGSS